MTLFAEASGKAWGQIDFLVHAIAFSDKDELKGRYMETTADNFTKWLPYPVILLPPVRSARRS